MAEENKYQYLSYIDICLLNLQTCLLDRTQAWIQPNRQQRNNNRNNTNRDSNHFKSAGDSSHLTVLNKLQSQESQITSLMPSRLY